MKRSLFCIMILLATLATGLVACTAEEEAEVPKTITIVDMVGRTVEVPANIERVVCTFPPHAIMTFAFVPDKLIAWNYDMSGAQYIHENYLTLPVVGGWFGGKEGNYETFMQAQADIVIESTSMYYSDEKSIELANAINANCGGVPVVIVHDYLDRYDETIEFFGELFGESDKADELIEFYNRIMEIAHRASDIPQDERVTVYYAEGPNGLKTDPMGSRHTEVLDAVGAINVHVGSETTGFGRIDVSMEQVAEWDPDFILVDGKEGYDYILSDSRWQIMRAVKNNNVILIPSGPFDWFDRPPGINRIMGIPWLAKTLYPDYFSDVDLNSLIKESYSKFYHYDLSDADVQDLLSP